jgi:hypothetical protein
MKFIVTTSSLVEFYIIYHIYTHSVVILCLLFVSCYLFISYTISVSKYDTHTKPTHTYVTNTANYVTSSIRSNIKNAVENSEYSSWYDYLGKTAVAAPFALAAISAAVLAATTSSQEDSTLFETGSKMSAAFVDSLNENRQINYLQGVVADGRMVTVNQYVVEGVKQNDKYELILSNTTTITTDK